MTSMPVYGVQQHLAQVVLPTQVNPPAPVEGSVYADNGVLFVHDGTDWVEIGPAVGGGGTTILSGTATPSAGTGAVGDYYLDTDDLILYGPKGLVPGSSEYVDISMTGASTFSGSFMLGMRYRFAASGLVVGIRFWVPATAGATTGWECYLFSNTGTLLASKDATVTLGAYNSVLFDSPVTVAAATTYLAAIFTTSGANSSASKAGAFPGMVSGNVTALANGVDGKVAVYGAGRDTFPDTLSSSEYYGISPLFSGTMVGNWPVALEGGFHVGTSAPSNTTLVWVDTT